MPSPKLVPLVLSDAKWASLEALVRKRTASQSLAQRARIVLACADESGMAPVTGVAGRLGSRGRWSASGAPGSWRTGTPGSLMFGRSDLNAWLGEFLAEHADAILGSAGFRRRAGARSARRKTGYGAQKIEFFAYSRPAYAPGQAHLVLKAWFYMPEVMQLARQIFGPSFTIDPADPGLAGGVDLDSLRQQEPLGLWLFADQAQLRSHAPQVQGALRKWVLPFLDASSTLDAFANGPAREHLRVEVVAAAYVQLGQPASALRYLQQRAAAGTESALLTPVSLRALNTLTAYLTDIGQNP